MTVYEVIADSNNYQSLLPDDESFWRTDGSVFDGRRKDGAWKPPKVYSYNPVRPAGDFWHFGSGCVVATPECANTLRTQFEMAGELLDLPYKGQTFTLLNILECADCLDAEGSEWVYGKSSGRPIRITRYSFHKHRFSESTIFKIPQFVRGSVFTVEGIKDPEDEFKHVVETSGLTGLRFKKVWEG